MQGGSFWALTERCGAKPPRIAVLVALAALFLGNYQWPDQIAMLIGILSLGLFVYCTFAGPVERVMMDATSAVFGLIYVGLTLLSIPLLREEPNGPIAHHLPALCRMGR